MLAIAAVAIAVYWRRSHLQNKAQALFERGLEYRMTNTNTEACNLYREAADLGFPRAQYHLGMMYKFGLGVEKDLTQTMKLFKQAADGGYAYAQRDFGCWHAKDLNEAIQHWRAAAGQGEVISRDCLKQLVEGDQSYHCSCRSL
jgi:TPR repeat protein